MKKRTRKYLKFGEVPNPEEVDFTIPPDHPDTKRILEESKRKEVKIHVGYSKWNKTDFRSTPKNI